LHMALACAAVKEALVMDDESLENIVAAALERIRATVEHGTPFMAQRLLEWMSSLYLGHSLQEYWTDPDGFPLLLAPWCLGKALRQQPDPLFRQDLIYSTMNMYYHLRLIDNLMDRDVPTDLTLLPALGFFHTEFQRPYHRHFDYEHAFWDYFTNVWFQSAEVTMLDASILEFDATQFERIAARKMCAAKISLAAVCYKYDRTDALPAWSRFIERYGWWAQMLNDTFGWLKDSQNNAVTFFLSEARRRKYPDESLTEWVIREGFEWAMVSLETSMSELRALANDLESPGVMEHLDMRAAAFTEKRDGCAEGLRCLGKLREALNRNS
jgi:hypothetical protein